MAQHSSEPEPKSRVGAIVGVLVAVAIVGLVVAGMRNCGPSALAKAYQPYDDKAEKLLDADLALWKRLAVFFNEQRQDEAAEAKYEALVLKEAVPQYDQLVKDVAALPPGAPELAAAQETLAKHAASRAALAHLLADNVDMMRPSAALDELGSKMVAAETAVEAYDRWVHDDPMRVADARFTELHGIRNEFTNRLEEMKRHRATRGDMEDYLSKDAIPRVNKLRSGRFDEDEPSRKLREAIATTAELYQAFVAALPALARQIDVAAEIDRLRHESDDTLKKFQQEMQTVRSRM